MEVLLNGELHPIEQDCSIGNLITILKLDGKFAIEVNQNIIPRSEYLGTKLHAGDKVEIVQAIGGG